MKALTTGFVLTALATLAGCSADGGSSSDPTVATDTATAVQDITVLDCQKQAASCARTAKSFLDLGHCTVQFQSCTTQAAADLVNQGNVLKDCRSKATACLDGAVTVTDISACRALFATCSEDVANTATNVLGDAIQTAKDAIEKTGTIALGVIQEASGVTTGALDALVTCETQANKCLGGVVSVGNITECQDVFEACTSKAVALVSGVVDPLPGPNPTQIVDGFKGCQTSAQACLAGAVTAGQISACKNTLATCVGNATSLIDQTVNDVNQILPLPLPLPTKPIDCSAQAAQCVLSLKSPLQCATEATQCLTK